MAFPRELQAQIQIYDVPRGGGGHQHAPHVGEDWGDIVQRNYDLLRTIRLPELQGRREGRRAVAVPLDSLKYILSVLREHVFGRGGGDAMLPPFGPWDRFEAYEIGPYRRWETEDREWVGMPGRRRGMFDW